MNTLESKIELSKSTNQTVLISECNGIKCFVEPVSNSNKMRFFRVQNNVTTIFKIA